jgi:hypothetical protein
MRWLVPTAAAVSALSIAALASGCATTCAANPDKLAALRRGMTYDETVRIMGCEGKGVTEQGPRSGAFSIVEWDGPESILFTRTQIDFLEGRLLSYTTGKRGSL